MPESDVMYLLAKENNLITYAIEHCNNACAIAFLGGKKRISMKTTEFSFNQYSTMSPKGDDLGNDSPAKRHQSNDVKKFKQQKVRKNFINKIYKTQYANPWYPGEEEMLRSNYVHRFVYQSKMVSGL